MHQFESADANSFQDVLIEPRVRLSLCELCAFAGGKAFHAEPAKDAKKRGNPRLSKSGSKFNLTRYLLFRLDRLINSQPNLNWLGSDILRITRTDPVIVVCLLKDRIP